ncbi:MAG: type II toxin-antitoxin system VapC family toxin [Chloroflexi bacterium]|nr:MAG: type II toxin-antitoxin system VapC family toxin [Chloroflexota bacterium]
MGWVEELRGKVIGVDTAPFIYFIERKPIYVDTLRPFFQAVSRGDIRIVTSTVTLLEVLVVPLRNNEESVAQQYRDILFRTQGLTTYVVTRPIAEEAARLRAVHNLRTPDSIHMATAINAAASFFLTNDVKLPSSPRLPTLVLDNLIIKS